MDTTTVSLARSLLDSVLSGVGAAVTDKVARLVGVPKEVEFIRNELEMARYFLKVASAHPNVTPRKYDIVKTSVKQVRDLAYDIEDCLLDLMLYAARASSSPARSWLPSAVAERHRIAERIRYLKASVEEVNVNQRTQRDQIVLDSPAVPRVEEQSMLPDHGMNSAELAFQALDIIGRDLDKDSLKQLISGRHGPVKVVSVWGMGGVGKSSLVWKVHNDPVLLDEFDCGAWVTMPHPLDNPEVFRQRLRKELGLASNEALLKYLQEKRYRVVVDDVESSEEWDNICEVFPPTNNKDSRIIVTTRGHEIAKHCVRRVAERHWDGQVYELKPLGYSDSKKLLCFKIFGTTTSAEDMMEQAIHILKRCRGFPLAISTIAGLLANKPSIEWSNLHEHLGAVLESDLPSINKVIGSSFDGLPYYLKQIFLYLSIFPENYEIKRSRLIRRWMAEGYITNNQNMQLEDVGERYYNQLIKRSMIQGSKANRGVGAGRCWVHSMVLQVILPMFIEQNQLFRVEKTFNDIPKSKIRHLVVSGWKGRDEKLHRINPSYIRSLTVFGEYPSSLISPKMRQLRVLDLEDTLNMESDDLKHIGELQHLRYLSLRGTGISKLPSSLQNLRYLETLDIQDTYVTHLPGGIAKLEKLRNLVAGVNFTKDLLKKMSDPQERNHGARTFGVCCNRSESCEVLNENYIGVRAPEGIEKLKNLHMLGVVNVAKGNGVSGRLKKLTSLTNLQRLGISGLTEDEGPELCKSIGGMSRLQRIEVRSDSIKFLNRMDELEIPRHLVSLRLCGKLNGIPEWASSLNNLVKVKLLGTKLKQEDIERLQNLSSLAVLGLWENSYIEQSLCFSASTFPKLKILDIDELQKIKNVTIREGAMLQLEELSLNKCPSLEDNSSGLSGVQYLPRLKELLLKNCGEKQNLIEELQGHINRHPRRPKFLIGKSRIVL